MNVNLYDFDKTIYDGDSTIDFYLYCFKHHPSIIKYVPKQIYYIILYKLKKINKTEMKEKFYLFLNALKNPQKDLQIFWTKHFKKIKTWYLNQNHNKDIIISASPEFLLEYPCQKLNVKKLIASKVNMKTGKYTGINCHGLEKVQRLNNEISNYKVINAYSDSLSDLPMLNLAEHKYIVKKNKIKELL